MNIHLSILDAHSYWWPYRHEQAHVRFITLLQVWLEYAFVTTSPIIDVLDLHGTSIETVACFPFGMSLRTLTFIML